MVPFGLFDEREREREREREHRENELREPQRKLFGRPKVTGVVS